MIEVFLLCCWPIASLEVAAEAAGEEAIELQKEVVDSHVQVQVEGLWSLAWKEKRGVWQLEGRGAGGLHTQSAGFSDGGQSHKQVKQVWQVPTDVGRHSWQESSDHQQGTGEDCNVT